MIPDEVDLICKANSPRAQFSIRVQEQVPSYAFPQNRLQGSIGANTINDLVTKLLKLQMVYVCGPEVFVRDTTKLLKEAGLTDDKIFIV